MRQFSSANTFPQLESARRSFLLTMSEILCTQHFTQRFLPAEYSIWLSSHPADKRRRQHDIVPVQSGDHEWLSMLAVLVVVKEYSSNPVRSSPSPNPLQPSCVLHLTRQDMLATSGILFCLSVRPMGSQVLTVRRFV